MADENIAAVSGFSNIGLVRQILYQGGRQVNAPYGTGLQPLDATLTTIAALTGAANKSIYFTGTDVAALYDLTAAGRALIDDADATAQRATLGLGSAALVELTSWVAYTPTFTGFGTAASISFFSRRVGDTLHIRGKFTAGTPTATEARITLGFNGTNANVNSDATKVPSIMLAGPMVTALTTAVSLYTLIESNVGYLTFGVQSAGTSALTKATGSGMSGTGTVMSLMAEVPISGW